MTRVWRAMVVVVICALVAIYWIFDMAILGFTTFNIFMAIIFLTGAIVCAYVGFQNHKENRLIDKTIAKDLDDEKDYWEDSDE